MKIYLLSGLGADERAFENLVFPQHVDTEFIPWITPLKNESLASYALRMSEAIDETVPFGLAGISLGGMLAVEIAKVKKSEITILISSTPLSSGIPTYAKWLGKFRAHQLIPIKQIGEWGVASWFFGTSSNSESNLIKRFIEKTPSAFLKWAIDAILKWRNNEIPENVFLIHGSLDKLLPINRLKPQFIVKNGGHLMVYTKGKQISEYIAEIMLKLNPHVQ